ncbi:MAG: glycoside hydrolase family 3 N-terminal domain-containing protein [Pseudomonadota bacterium]|nr:glycoside hydrolase family 3 N-terminal domain-containing protein [Pseudomonadota bacterium]
MLATHVCSLRALAPLLFGLALLGWAPAAAPAATPVYKDPSAPVEARVNDLLKRMTLEEKIAQITTLWQNKVEVFDDDLQFDAAKASANFPNGIGQIARPSDRRGAVSPREAPGRDAKETVALINAAQKWAIENTRLGVPILFHEEALHGYAAVDATSFPQAIALASTWDPELIREVNSVIAREVRARGVSLVLSPVVDVARDPRWGRIEETFGEDPYLVGEMGVASVLGLQGETLPLADGKVFATLKHMTGHGQPESGTNVGPSQISERTLRENFFPPFEEVVKRTNIHAVMASYNEIDGVPSHANAWLLGDILRGEWKYDGAVVSDYFAIEQMAEIHHIEPDIESAAVRALNAGVDVDLPDGVAFRTLIDAVRKGEVSEKRIDAAVKRFLTIKFLAGLFEHPYADGEAADALTGDDEARALALKAAQRAPVLLKNDGVLPLSADGFKTLAVIGPNANVARLGGYSGKPRQTVNFLEGVRAKVGDAAKIVYAEGVSITDSDDWWADEVNLADPKENEKRIKEAVKTARSADMIVLVLGDTEQTSREAWADNHLGDRTELTLPGQQDELAEAIFKLGKPTVVVLLNGRPPAVVNIAEKANALIEGWYLGQEGGTAMADILFGDVNPGGKLPVTIARSSGQLPMFYNRKPSARRGYLFDTTEPLYPFGYGLSYTTFEIGKPRLSSAEIGVAGSAEVSVDVTNTGGREGDEVVQLYVRDVVSSVTRPVKELKGFERVTLAPGETKTVTFPVTSKTLRFWDKNMKRVVEPGEFEIMVGPNSVDLKTAVLTVK